MAPLSRKPVPPPRNQYAGLRHPSAGSTLDPSNDRAAAASMNNDDLRPAVTNQSDRCSGSSIKTTEYQIIEREKTSPWHINWTSPALMLGLFLLGIACAIAHHFFYSSLHGTDVESNMSQEWAIRVGTGLAFVAKASLAASVGVAYTQRLWLTLRKKAVTLAATDSLFQLTMNPMSFFSWEVLRKGKVLSLMAAAMWCIPLIATITPATLAVNLATRQSIEGVSVPTLDFDAENSHRYYSEVVQQASNAGEDDPTVADNSTGILQSPSDSLRQLFRAVVTGGNALQTSSPFPNSTFELQFYGPSLKCYNLTSPTSLDFTRGPANNPADQEEVDMLRPINKNAQNNYWAAIDHWNPNQASYWGFNGEGWKPVTGKPVTMRWDELYLGIDDRNRVLDTYHMLLVDQYVVSCMLWNTSYTVTFSSTGSEQSTTITQPLDRINEVHLNRSTPLASYTYAEGAYKAYSELFRSFIIGGTETTPIGRGGWSTTGEHEMLSSNLKYCPEFDRVYNLTGRVEKPALCGSLGLEGNLMEAIEELSRNITLSLLTSDELSRKTTVDVALYKSVNQYSYNWQNLALAYGVGIFVALLGVVIGGFSCIANGYSASMSFSSIILTTRNPDLDRLFEGHCLPTLPLGKKLGKTKLRYGLLKSDGAAGDHEHAAFGLADTITELKKGMKCT